MEVTNLGTQIPTGKSEPVPTTPVTTGWRNYIAVHPLAANMPPISPEGFAEMVADIKEGGIQNEVAIYRDADGNEFILDGCTRLDAAEAAGLPIIKDDALNFDVVPHRHVEGNVDLAKFVRSQNLLRRHLTGEQKRAAVAELLKAQPEQSDRSIARQIGVDHKTVAAERGQMESRGEIPHVEARTDSLGRRQQAHTPKAALRRVQAFHRAAKLGEGTLRALEGTSLGKARELDELVILNRGAPPGEHTEVVRRLIARAIAGEAVSAIATGKGIESGWLDINGDEYHDDGADQRGHDEDDAPEPTQPELLQLAAPAEPQAAAPVLDSAATFFAALTNLIPPPTDVRALAAAYRNQIRLHLDDIRDLVDVLTRLVALVSDETTPPEGGWQH